MRQIMLASLGTAFLLSACGGGGGSGSSGPPPNPAPTVSSLSPSSATAGGAAFTLTVNGTNFIAGSNVDWNGSSRTTTYVSSTQLTAAITATDIASAGTGTVPVTVVNPSPGGGTSAAVNLSLTNPVPAVSSLSPSTETVGGPAFTLMVTGSGFVAASVVQWNGSSRATTFVNASELTASINAADIATTGNVTVTVATPSPGGGISTELGIVLSNPSPTVSSLSQTSAAAGGAAFTLTVTGTNFTPGSVVVWNGTNQMTTYVSPTQLTVQITAPDIAAAGSATVFVFNGTPGGGASTPAPVTLTGTLPATAYFVATNGSDTNPGTIAQPYLTIQKCASTVASGSTCYIRAGTYYETVTPNSGITISSYDGETVTVDGTDAVTGWTVYQGSIYQATVTMSTGDTNQIFANGQMMTEARWPNGDDLFHVNWATAQTGTTDSTGVLVDSNLPNINWTGAHIHLWSGTDPWDPQTGVVTASQTGQLTYTVDGASFCPYICAQAGGYYYLFGILGALDTQREWTYVASSNTLYFWAPGGVDPNTLSTRVKQRQYAFDLSGQSNVTIQFINLFASTINTNASSTNNTINGINAQYVSHFTTLPDSGGYPSSYWYDHTTDTGIVLSGSGNILENSAIAYSAGNGVALSGNNNTAKNNLIHHVDYMGNYSSGITISGNTQEIQYDTIYATGRFSIFPSSGMNGAQDISYNNLFNSMMISIDGGEIYAGSAGAGTQIHNNWMHDSQILIPAQGAQPSGVYIDEDASGYEIDQNVIWNNQGANILLQGSNDGTVGPNDNDVHNNTVPDVGSSYSVLVGQIAIPICGTTQIVDNLVLIPVSQPNNPPCTATDNNATAPGANQMTAAVQVGCNFAGCASEGPPAISGTSVAASIATQPYGLTVPAGLTATFSVTGAGSPPLSYQWLKNGVTIAGATGAIYTTPATVAVDSGAVFTVQVSNSVGSVTSNAAVLTVD